MKIYNQCKCGLLFRLSKIENDFIKLDKINHKFNLKIKNQNWEIKYCPDCVGKNPSGDLNDEKCSCRLKKHLLKDEFADLVETDEGLLYIKLRAIKIPHPSPKEPDVTAFVPFYLPNCFNCGDCLFNPSEMKIEGIEHSYSTEELDDVFDKLAQINAKEEALSLFGKPDDVIGIGFWGQTEDTVDYQYKIIQETHFYSELYKTLSLRIDYYFDGELGYQIVALNSHNLKSNESL